MEREEIINLINAGLSRREIAQHFSVAEDTVSRNLIKFNLRIPKDNVIAAKNRTRAVKNTSAVWAEKIKKSRRELISAKLTAENATQWYIVERMNLKDIAAETGLSKSSVERLLKEYGLSAKQRGVFNLDKVALETMHINEHKTHGEIAKNYGVSRSRIRQLCAEHGVETNWKYISNTSQGEQELLNFIKSLTPVCRAHDRTLLRPSEIDIYCPEQGVAFEYHGEYWHSDTVSHKLSTYKKWKALQHLGIRLVIVWESEWQNKQEIWKNKIRNLLKCSAQNTIYARKCEVKEVHTTVKNSFLRENHIQGPDSSFRNLGLFYLNELVAIMTFRNSRNNKEIELSRYATNCHIPGGFSKLLKHSGYSEVYSWSDNRLSDGNMYAQTDWQKVKQTPADYTVFYKNKFYHKSYFRKTNLKKLFPELEGTEWEIEDTVRALRCWDCGKIKWKKTVDKSNSAVL